MAWYDINGNPLSAVYDINGNPLTDDMFILFADEHTSYLVGDKTFKNLDVDWTKLYMIDLGDDALNLTYEEVVSQSNYGLNGRKDALSHIPEERQIILCGNHDLFWRNESDTLYLANPEENPWILEKYFPNTGATNVYGNDVVRVDSAHGIKYMSISAWDNDGSLGGYSAYGINQSHMDAIINELEKNDGLDIVILSHVPVFRTYDSKRIPQTDGNVDSEYEWTADPIAKTSCTFDDMLKARNDQTSGTITDSYGNIHNYDFSSCTGKILCCLSGHEHADYYGYRYGILQYIFDSAHYDKKPYYFGSIDKYGGKLKLRKVCNDDTVYSYNVPLTN